MAKTSRKSNLDRPEAKRLLRFADHLSVQERTALERQIEEIDFDLLARLFRQSVEPALKIEPQKISPTPVIELPRNQSDQQRWDEADMLGREALAAGRCGVLLSPAVRARGSVSKRQRNVSARRGPPDVALRDLRFEDQTARAAGRSSDSLVHHDQSHEPRPD